MKREEDMCSFRATARNEQDMRYFFLPSTPNFFPPCAEKYALRPGMQVQAKTQQRTVYFH